MFKESQHLIATCSVKKSQNPSPLRHIYHILLPVFSHCAVAEVRWVTVRQARRQCWRQNQQYNKRTENLKQQYTGMLLSAATMAKCVHTRKTLSLSLKC